MTKFKCIKRFLESFLPLKPNQMTYFQLLLLFVLMSLWSLSPSTRSPSLAAPPKPRPILDPEAETNALEAELNRGGSREERSGGGGWEGEARTRPDLACGKSQPRRGELSASERAGGQEWGEFSESFLSNTCLTFVPFLLGFVFLTHCLGFLEYDNIHTVQGLLYAHYLTNKQQSI